MGDKVAGKMSFCVVTTKCAWNKTPPSSHWSSRRSS